MSARPIVTAGGAGALLAGGLAALAPKHASFAIACFNLVPDIVAFARSAPGRASWRGSPTWCRGRWSRC